MIYHVLTIQCSHHCGSNVLGHTFKQAHPSYRETFIIPYGEFLHQIFHELDMTCMTGYGLNTYHSPGHLSEALPRQG